MHRFISRKMMIVFAVFNVLIILFCGLAFVERFFMSFKKGISLNYQRNDVTFIKIRSTGNLTDIEGAVIDDPGKITEVIALINSFELVASKIPSFGETYDDLAKSGWILVYMGESSDYNPGDIIEFSTNYMKISYNGHDWDSKSYYVKNSEYNNQTKSRSALKTNRLIFTNLLNKKT